MFIDKPDSSRESQRILRARHALSSVRFLAELPLEVQLAVASIATPRHYHADQVIYLEGEPGTALYILEKGWVKATRMSREGREQALLFLRSGEIFGDIAVFTGVPYPGTVVALEPVDVWVIEQSKILELVNLYPALAMAMIRRLGERVLYYVGLVEDLSLRSVEARLANTLLQHMEYANGRILIPRQSWTTFDEMAIRLGTVRDALSRALRAFEERGLLRVEKHAIVILDPERLMGLANP